MGVLLVVIMVAVDVWEEVEGVTVEVEGPEVEVLGGFVEVRGTLFVPSPRKDSL